MRVDLGARVRTKDGHDAGHLEHAIWDPRGSEITQYVITSGGPLEHHVIVSSEVLESAKRDGSADWAAPAVHGYPTGGHLWPVADAEVAPVGTMVARRRS